MSIFVQNVTEWQNTTNLARKGKPQQPTSLQKKATPSFIVIGDVASKELDIVAKYNNELIVVEVKSRKDIRFGNPEEAVNDRKIRHIIASTDAYLRKFAIDLPVRFDIITVVGQEAPFQIEHIADAFYSPIW